MRISISNAARRAVVALCTGVAFTVLLVGADARATEHPAANSAASETAHSSILDESCFNCSSGAETGCAANQHKDSQHSSPSNYKYEIHSGCVLSMDQNNLCGEHTGCAATRGELLQLAVLLLKRDDQPGLGKLIAENSSTLLVDATSKQVLVVGCDGSLLAQLDLTKSQLRSLANPEVLN